MSTCTTTDSSSNSNYDNNANIILTISTITTVVITTMLKITTEMLITTKLIMNQKQQHTTIQEQGIKNKTQQTKRMMKDSLRYLHEIFNQQEQVILFPYCIQSSRRNDEPCLPLSVCLSAFVCLPPCLCSSIFFLVYLLCSWMRLKIRFRNCFQVLDDQCKKRRFSAWKSTIREQWVGSTFQYRFICTFILSESR